MDMNNVNLSVVVGLVERVIDDYKARGIHNVDLGGVDTYVAIAPEEMFDVYAEQVGPFPIGSLSDDLMELGKLMSDADRMPTAVDIERLGNLLRAISTVV
jgi:hypothetical protein